ncbi:MAG: hypothetical protein J1F61_00795 [Clostridiales bacterium]|nr:hypothetical protein [Clostridiales bacterium]
MIKKYKLTYVFAAIVATMLFIFSYFVGGGALNAYAVTVATTDFEQSNVLDDLEGSVIEGEPFSLEEFGFDEEKETRLLVLVEFGYSFYSNMQQDYGLYAYVYNPQGIDFVTDSPLNKISLRYGDNDSDKPVKYDLQFVNQSTDKGAEGLFYKFKIVLSDAQRKDILAKVSGDERVYEIPKVELYAKSAVNAVAIPVARKYRYSGYSENYGPLTMTESTLILRVDNVEEHLKLDVKHTVYRPQGDYYNGQQSQLNSCYFRVPEKYFSEYGELINIGCEWYEYVTQPILVTENGYLYEQLRRLHGASFENFSANNYFVVAEVSSFREVFPNKLAGVKLASNYKNFDDEYSATFTPDAKLFSKMWLEVNSSRINNFAAVFGATNYSTRSVSSDELINQFLENSEVLGGTKINGKYSEALFTDTVDDFHTRGKNTKEIGKDDLMDVFWNTTTKSFWDKFFGGYNVDTTFDAVKAIEEVTADKLKGTDFEISKRLYVSENDVSDLKAEAEKAKLNDERLVLFRYSSSNYSAIRCVEATCSKSVSNAEKSLADALCDKVFHENFTAYTFRETVYLDFDIIYLTYELDNVKTVIPVISSPQDVISDSQPPLKEDYHTGSGAGAETFSIIMIVFGSIILAGLFVYFIIWINENVNQSKKE